MLLTEAIKGNNRRRIKEKLAAARRKKYRKNIDRAKTLNSNELARLIHELSYGLNSVDHMAEWLDSNYDKEAWERLNINGRAYISRQANEPPSDDWGDTDWSNIIMNG